MNQLNKSLWLGYLRHPNDVCDVVTRALSSSPWRVSWPPALLPPPTAAVAAAAAAMAAAGATSPPYYRAPARLLVVGCPLQ